MNRLQNDFPLKKYNSFGFDVNAKLYFSFSDEKQIIDFLPIIREKNYPILVLGGGSNILFTQDFSGIVIHPLNKGIKIIAEKADDILIKVSAGETWDDFVAWAVDHNYYGVENLSHIPGNVGATPIQNIGAYGVELANSLEKLKAIEINTGKEKYFTNKECDFGYRSSIFKHQLKGQYIITEVFFRLKKTGTLNTSYGAINDELLLFPEINLQNLRKSIINIRRKKLPEPSELGNAGSFFKNPVVSKRKAEELKEQYRDMPIYPDGDKIKLAAGWLIDKCGCKEISYGDAGVHKDQALVLVNYGRASGSEIIYLSEKIKETVYQSFGVELETEVNIL